MAKTERDLFPVRFILERVKNGYILTSKDENDVEEKFKKEVVPNDSIYSRVGKLLNIDSLVPETPVIFYVDQITKNVTTANISSAPSANFLMKYRYATYVKVAKKMSKDTFVLLNIKDTGMLEMYGNEAEETAKKNGITPKYDGNIAYISLQSNTEGRKTFSQYYNKLSIIDVNLVDIVQWNASHQNNK